MENGLHAETENMQQSSKSTIDLASTYEEELSSLRGHIEELMSIWNGSAASAFEKVYEEEAETFAAFQQLLNNLGEAVGQASRILQNADETGADMARKLG